MELINNTVNEYLNKFTSNNSKNEMSTGFYDLDYVINGLNKGELIVIASRPAMGKTALAFNIAVNVAIKEKVPVSIFSLEIAKEQCIERFITSQSLVPKNKIRTNNLNDEEIQQIKKAKKELSEAQIYIDDTPAISINEIKEKCIKLKNKNNVGLIVIDYLQLIQNNSIDKNICTVLKELAQKLNVPIIVTSQLSRAPQERFEKGEDPRPIISDINNFILKESDILLFLYRDDYYNVDSEKKDIAELIIARNKFGDTGSVELLFMKDYLRYVNLERYVED